MTAATRLYKVTMGKEIHLVDARTKQQAVAHVAKSKCTAEICTALEAAQMVLAGVVPEFAGKDAPHADADDQPEPETEEKPALTAVA